MMTMINVTTITTRVTTMITTTTRTLAELDCKMQYFAAMHDCSCLFLFQLWSGTMLSFYFSKSNLRMYKKMYMCIYKHLDMLLTCLRVKLKNYIFLLYFFWSKVKYKNNNIYLILKNKKMLNHICTRVQN